MSEYTKLVKELRKKADPVRAKNLQGFFKTKPGEYGAGDVFLGITVPEIRKTAHNFSKLSFISIKKLLSSKIHEHRLTALEILVIQYEGTSNQQTKKKIVQAYIKNRKGINNWDLVDLSTPYILGDWFKERDKSLLYRWANSKNVWERRMAIIATANFIRFNQFTDTLKISKLLLNDKHDLIQKAVGWMLREVGKKSLKTEKEFLDIHYKKMPRTMLRYAIERLSKKDKTYYMKKI
ncbi:MAG: putative DNA alkylation repair enzyme [Candidatus Doudnabacteria bacterium Gr01-1014_77]|uniref:Putative DNA alkylation repair enzyme n=1 Tax=Candidatus Doudnabacteria bacterium Gr01-1014_77 TaxID=2017133 RepID=A0A554JAI7_9BACT|nr:MAG: putative DNA alkylation repair enzyme [Candidatus Doudnabacteria bacterium Gr01-1014_77]